MKFIVVVLMPGKNDDTRFMLKRILSCAYNQLQTFKNCDNHLLYQAQIVDNLHAANDMLQILNIESDWQFIMDADVKLQVTELNHAVIEVPDDLDENLPLSDQVIRVHILKPEEYISADNTLTDAIKALESKLESHPSERRHGYNTRSMFNNQALAANEKEQLQQELDELKTKQVLLEQCSFVTYKYPNAKVEDNIDEVPRLLLRNNAQPDLAAYFDEFMTDDDEDSFINNNNNEMRFTR